MLVQASYAGRRPYHNYSCVILTTTSHLVVIGSLSHVASLIHAFRCYVRIPDGPPNTPVWISHTADAIYSSLGRSLLISTGWTRSSMESPYGIRILYRSSCSVVTLYSPSRVDSGRPTRAWQYHFYRVRHASCVRSAASIDSPPPPVLYFPGGVGPLEVNLGSFWSLCCGCVGPLVGAVLGWSFGIPGAMWPQRSRTPYSLRRYWILRPTVRGIRT